MHPLDVKAETYFNLTHLACYVNQKAYPIFFTQKPASRVDNLGRLKYNVEIFLPCITDDSHSDKNVTTQKEITVLVNNITYKADKGVIIAPKEALETQSLVKPVVHGERSSGKHTAYTLAQIAKTRYDDGEIVAQTIHENSKITVFNGDTQIDCSDGIVILWASDVLIFTTAQKLVSPLLRTVTRETTRWIRLDVR